MADSFLPGWIVQYLTDNENVVPRTESGVRRFTLPLFQDRLPFAIDAEILDTFDQTAHLQERLEEDLAQPSTEQEDNKMHPRFAELVPTAERQKWTRFLTLLGAHIEVYRGDIFIFEDGTTGASANWNGAQPPPLPPVLCSICMSNDIDVETFDHGWWCDVCQNENWCRDCVVQAFGLSLQDQSPRPRCGCRESVDITEVHHVLPTSLLQEKADKIRALDAKEPLYCAKATCARFLQDNAALADPDSQVKPVLCKDCGTTTCRFCRELMSAHDESEKCPSGNIIEARQQLTEGTSMRTCRCGNVIERHGGCNHMTCSECSYEFCIICNKEWKTCDCPIL